MDLSDSESMKVRPNIAVSMLYSGMQCGSCGLRFPADQTVRYSTHLDWHFRQNRREKGASKRPQSRKWYATFSLIALISVTNAFFFHRYCSVPDWIQFEETEGSEEKRLNWFEAQAKEKSEKDGERVGEESTSYVSILITFVQLISLVIFFFVAGTRVLLLQLAVLLKRTSVLFATRN